MGINNNIINDFNGLMGYINNTIKCSDNNDKSDVKNNNTQITYEKYSNIYDYQGNKEYYESMNYKERWKRVTELEKVTVMFE